MTSRTMLEKVRSGQREGWERFYHKYKRFIMKVAIDAARSNGFPVSHHEACELLQDIMVAVAVNGQLSYDESKGTKFRSWFCGLIRHKVIDWIRKESRRRRVLVPLPDCGALGGVPEIVVADPGPAIDQEWSQLLRLARFNRALELMRNGSDIDPRTVRAFEMNALQEKPAGEVAKLLGVSVNTVYSHKHRCIKHLQDIYTRLTVEEGVYAN